MITAISFAVIGLLILVSNTPAAAHTQVGKATVYSDKYVGRKTASGARYNPHALTAASPSLPFGTRVRVTNLRTKRTVRVTINDRLARNGRLLDLSKHAARQLGVTGVAAISMTIVD